MACNNYLPRFQDQINSIDPLGGLNCTCYSGAMAGDFDTCGVKRPTGKRVRELTGDKSGGTTLLQVDTALNKGWGINLDTRIGSSKLTWTQFAREIDKGKSAILQGSYRVIHGTRFQGDRSFVGNHAIFVPTGWGAMDPLCDGRAPGIYKYHGEKYPKDLLKRFAGALELRPGVRLGTGYVWCALTRDNRSNYLVSIRPADPDGRYPFYRYFVNSEGIITGRKRDTTSGFSATCTPPKTYRAKSGLTYSYKRLVELTNGSRDGWYVEARWAKEV